MKWNPECYLATRFCIRSSRCFASCLFFTGLWHPMVTMRKPMCFTKNGQEQSNGHSGIGRGLNHSQVSLPVMSWLHPTSATCSYSNRNSPAVYVNRLHTLGLPCCCVLLHPPVYRFSFVDMGVGVLVVLFMTM